MQRLRHPIRSIREPFGKAGLTVAILALVFAMVGGAWAAVGLNSKQKKEVTKIAKKFAGKPGPAGAAGTNGTNGTNGAKGDTGAAGSAGTNGTSVTTSAATVGECPDGGTKFTSASPASKVCNGLTGFTSTLPPGKTEAGTWGFGGTSGALPQFSPISFTIPLAGAPEAADFHFIKTPGEEAAACPGTVEEPQAASGQLCVYSAILLGVVGGEATMFISGTSGIVMSFNPDGSGLAGGAGAWAVTG